ncbi:MAG: hypothetical protein K0R38_6566 [Polyangiaceae bacterium]|nr:hypothetical protein [Polyangiaceae bacterium]
MTRSSAGFPFVLLRLALTGTGCAAAAVASPALADYARPPEAPYDAVRVLEPEAPAPERTLRPASFEEPSTFRFHVGPALLVQPVGPGLSAALDIGRRAVGARIGGTWLRPESERGLASYSAELWIDLRHRSELHPILAAGASWLHGGALEAPGKRSAGAGVLRGALEYELPIGDADARLGLNVTALVPAIQIERSRPWVVTSLMIGAGF